MGRGTSSKPLGMTPISMAAASLFLLLLLPLIHHAVAIKGLNNVLFSGDMLLINDKLFYKDSWLEMQSDCNFVIHSPLGGFYTGIVDHSYYNCYLYLCDDSSIEIWGIKNTARTQDIVWRSPAASHRSYGLSYAAMLRPDGRFAVYGPQVWAATPPLLSNLQQQHSSQRGKAPMPDGFLFDDQILYGGDKLITMDYSLIMKDDCNLVVEKAGQGVVWQSGTSGKGTYCFARLDRRGRFIILSDDYETVWTSGKQGSEVGEYVLMLLDNGEVTIYGPSVWISPRNQERGMIDNH